MGKIFDTYLQAEKFRTRPEERNDLAFESAVQLLTERRRLAAQAARDAAAAKEREAADARREQRGLAEFEREGKRRAQERAEDRANKLADDAAQAERKSKDPLEWAKLQQQKDYLDWLKSRPVKGQVSPPKVSGTDGQPGVLMPENQSVHEPGPKVDSTKMRHKPVKAPGGSLLTGLAELYEVSGDEARGAAYRELEAKVARDMERAAVRTSAMKAGRPIPPGYEESGDESTPEEREAVRMASIGAQAGRLLPAVAGAGAGAMAGSLLGPVGTAVGGAIGGGIGAMAPGVVLDYLKSGQEAAQGALAVPSRVPPPPPGAQRSPEDQARMEQIVADLNRPEHLAGFQGMDMAEAFSSQGDQRASDLAVEMAPVMAGLSIGDIEDAALSLVSAVEAAGRGSSWDDVKLILTDRMNRGVTGSSGALRYLDAIESSPGFGPIQTYSKLRKWITGTSLGEKYPSALQTLAPLAKSVAVDAPRQVYSSRVNAREADRARLSAEADEAMRYFDADKAASQGVDLEQTLDRWAAEDADRMAWLKERKEEAATTAGLRDALVEQAKSGEEAYSRAAEDVPLSQRLMTGRGGGEDATGRALQDERLLRRYGGKLPTRRPRPDGDQSVSPSSRRYINELRRAEAEAQGEPKGRLPGEDAAEVEAQAQEKARGSSRSAEEKAQREARRYDDQYPASRGAGLPDEAQEYPPMGQTTIRLADPEQLPPARQRPPAPALLQLPELPPGSAQPPPRTQAYQALPPQSPQALLPELPPQAPSRQPPPAIPQRRVEGPQEESRLRNLDVAARGQERMARSMDRVEALLDDLEARLPDLPPPRGGGGPGEPAIGRQALPPMPEVQPTTRSPMGAREEARLRNLEVAARDQGRMSRDMDRADRMLDEMERVQQVESPDGTLRLEDVPRGRTMDASELLAQDAKRPGRLDPPKPVLRDVAPTEVPAGVTVSRVGDGLAVSVPGRKKPISIQDGGYSIGQAKYRVSGTADQILDALLGKSELEGIGPGHVDQFRSALRPKGAPSEGDTFRDAVEPEAGGYKPLVRKVNGTWQVSRDGERWYSTPSSRTKKDAEEHAMGLWGGGVTARASRPPTYDEQGNVVDYHLDDTRPFRMPPQPEDVSYGEVFGEQPAPGTMREGAAWNLTEPSLKEAESLVRAKSGRGLEMQPFKPMLWSSGVPPKSPFPMSQADPQTPAEMVEKESALRRAGAFRDKAASPLWWSSHYPERSGEVLDLAFERLGGGLGASLLASLERRNMSYWDNGIVGGKDSLRRGLVEAARMAYGYSYEIEPGRAEAVGGGDAEWRGIHRRNLRRIQELDADSLGRLVEEVAGVVEGAASRVAQAHRGAVTPDEVAAVTPKPWVSEFRSKLKDEVPMEKLLSMADRDPGIAKMIEQLEANDDPKVTSRLVSQLAAAATSRARKGGKLYMHTPFSVVPEMAKDFAKFTNELRDWLHPKAKVEKVPGTPAEIAESVIAPKAPAKDPWLRQVGSSFTSLLEPVLMEFARHNDISSHMRLKRANEVLAIVKEAYGMVDRLAASVVSKVKNIDTLRTWYAKGITWQEARDHAAEEGSFLAAQAAKEAEADYRSFVKSNGLEAVEKEYFDATKWLYEKGYPILYPDKKVEFKKDWFPKVPAAYNFFAPTKPPEIVGWEAENRHLRPQAEGVEGLETDPALVLQHVFRSAFKKNDHYLTAMGTLRDVGKKHPEFSEVLGKIEAEMAGVSPRWAEPEMFLRAYSVLDAMLPGGDKRSKFVMEAYRAHRDVLTNKEGTGLYDRFIHLTDTIRPYWTAKKGPNEGKMKVLPRSRQEAAWAIDRLSEGKREVPPEVLEALGELGSLQERAAATKAKLLEEVGKSPFAQTFYRTFGNQPTQTVLNQFVGTMHSVLLGLRPLHHNLIVQGSDLMRGLLNNGATINPNYWRGDVAGEALKAGAAAWGEAAKGLIEDAKVKAGLAEAKAKPREELLDAMERLAGRPLSGDTYDSQVAELLKKIDTAPGIRLGLHESDIKRNRIADTVDAVRSLMTGFGFGVAEKAMATVAAHHALRYWDVLAKDPKLKSPDEFLRHLDPVLRESFPAAHGEFKSYMDQGKWDKAREEYASFRMHTTAIGHGPLNQPRIMIEASRPDAYSTWQTVYKTFMSYNYPYLRTKANLLSQAKAAWQSNPGMAYLLFSAISSATLAGLLIKGSTEALTGEDVDLEDAMLEGARHSMAGAAVDILGGSRGKPPTPRRADEGALEHAARSTMEGAANFASKYTPVVGELNRIAKTLEDPKSLIRLGNVKTVQEKERAKKEAAAKAAATRKAREGQEGQKPKPKKKEARR